jgi:putative flippase GtrA
LTARLRNELTRFSKFVVVGTIGAVVDFGTLNLLLGSVNIQSIYAQAISFSAAVVSNFLWNRYWTYPDSRSKQVRRQAAQFGMVSLVGLGIRSAIFALSEPMMGRFSGQLLELVPVPIEAIVLGTNLAVALAVIVVLFWNFGINRVWTYSDV